MPIGIFQGQLRLADAAQATDGLWLRKGRRLACVQAAANVCEIRITSQKEGITRIGNVPDRRQTGTEGRGLEQGQILDDDATNASSHIGQCRIYIPPRS